MNTFKFEIGINSTDDFVVAINGAEVAVNRSSLQEMKWAIDQALNTSAEELGDVE